jgi:hypothetical protein
VTVAGRGNEPARRAIRCSLRTERTVSTTDAGKPGGGIKQALDPEGLLNPGAVLPR